MEQAKEKIAISAEKYSKEIEKSLEAEMAIIRTLQQASRVYYKLPRTQWDPLFHEITANVFAYNDQFYSIYDNWELSHIDSTHKLPYGRTSFTYWRVDGKVLSVDRFDSMEGDPPAYADIKRRAEETIMEPYFDSYSDKEEDNIIMTSLISPIIENDQFIGIVGADISCERFRKLVGKIKIFDKSEAYLLSNQGSFVGHHDADKIGTLFKNEHSEEDKKFQVTSSIQKGKSFNYIAENKDGVEIYKLFTPINIGDTNTPWSLAINVPVTELSRKAISNFYRYIIAGIASFLIMGIILWIVTKKITTPLNTITTFLKKMAVGEIESTEPLNINTGDEIEEMSEALKSSIYELNNKSDFADNIAGNNLDYDYQLPGENDQLGKSLLNMRESLKKAHEEEVKRKQEDEKIAWINEGLAKFSDILRQNNDDLQKLAFLIIQNLVHYVNAIQGGIFILNDGNEDNPLLELIATYAFNRKKYRKKKVEIGEGLVGSCFLEKQTIYLTEIPDDYIEITSGLGGSNPRTLLIVPLVLEEQVLGVMEIASFNPFEKHVIDFIEKIGESIASTLNSVKINIRTSQLLERSQQQAEEMAAQEEEMRQNMEELQATQEESTRKTTEMEGLVQALNAATYVIEYDPDGYITNINDNYINTVGVKKEDVIGTHHKDNLEMTKSQLKEYENFWRELRSGKTRKQTTNLVIGHKTYIFAETYSPIKDENGKIVKIIKIANNITDYINQDNK